MFLVKLQLLFLWILFLSRGDKVKVNLKQTKYLKFEIQHVTICGYVNAHAYCYCGGCEISFPKNTYRWAKFDKTQAIK